MTDLTNQLERIRTELSTQDAQRQREERIRIKEENEAQDKSKKRLKEFLDITRDLWRPFLHEVHDRVYDQNLFKEIERFWGTFSSDFRFESSIWEKKHQPYIPIYWGGCRGVAGNVDTLHKLYATPSGFRYVFEPDDDHEHLKWFTIQNALDSHYQNRIKKHKISSRYVQTHVLYSHDIETVLGYATPFFLCEDLPLYNTGTIKDILDVSPKKLFMNINSRIQDTRKRYETRVKNLFDCIEEEMIN